MSETHLSKGSTCPPLAPGTLRIYNCRVCPYAQRAMMVLSLKKIPHEVCNVNIFDKPEWYFSKNPAGQTPTLEQDDKLIQESAICMDYLDDITPGHNLYPKDPYLKARMRLDMDNAAKITQPYYKITYGKFGQDNSAHVTELRERLTVIENMMKGKFISGDTPMMIDYFVYPWFERFCIGPYMTGSEWMPADQFPKLTAWYARMVALPEVKAFFNTPETHIKLFRQFTTAGAAAVDFNIAK